MPTWSTAIVSPAPNPLFDVVTEIPVVVPGTRFVNVAVDWITLTSSWFTVTLPRKARVPSVDTVLGPTPAAIPILLFAELVEDPTVTLYPIASASVPYAVTLLPIAIAFSWALLSLPNAIPLVATVLLLPNAIPKVFAVLSLP